MPDTDILYNVSKATFEADVDDNHSIRHSVVAWLREKKRYNNNMECTSNSSAEYEDITHWMPIPSFDEILEANKDVLKRIKENYKEPEKSMNPLTDNKPNSKQYETDQYQTAAL